MHKNKRVKNEDSNYKNENWEFLHPKKVEH